MKLPRWLAWLKPGGGQTARASDATTQPQSAYDMAAWGRRVRSWFTGNVGINASTAAAVDTMRARSRDLVRRNPWGGSGLDKLVANIVGTGITPRPRSEDAAYRAEVKALFRDWTDEADADGITDFYGLQSLAVREMVESGECFVRLRPRLASDGLSVPLQLQLLEAEHCPVWKNETLPTGGFIKNGIEFNAIGQRVAYWMTREHPGEYQVTQNGGDLVRIPAEQIVHLFRPIRAGQVRGIPWFSRVGLRMWELDQFDDAELAGKKVAAMFSGFITTPNPEEDAIPIPPATTASLTPNAAGLPEVQFEPASLAVLGPGQDVTFSTPPHDPAAAGFSMRQLRAIAAGLGLTYEALTGDMTQVNYSSARVALQEFRRSCEALIHQVVVFQFCRGIWLPWLDQAVLAGALDTVAPVAYRRNPREFRRCTWTPQGWGWVDPQNELNAAETELRLGLTSRSALIAARSGEDAEDVDAEIEADNERADAKGLVFDSDPRKTARTGARPTAPGAAGGGTAQPPETTPAETPAAPPAPARRRQPPRRRTGT